LPLVLWLLAATACTSDLAGTGNLCLHSEGCDGGGGSGGFQYELAFYGLVTSAQNGQSLAGVTVRIEVPLRGWSDTVLTSSTGNYYSAGVVVPSSGDCAGLSISFSREGFQPLRVTEFARLTCGSGFLQLNATLTPAS
jgi:hypothetical protein